MAAPSDITYLPLGLAGLVKEAAPGVSPRTPDFDAMRKRTLAGRNAYRQNPTYRPPVAPGSDFPAIEDAPGRVNPVAAGVRSLHTGAQPGLMPFKGSLGVLNPAMDFAWNTLLPPRQHLQGQNPYTQSPWLYNIPEVYRQGARTADYSLDTFRPYQDGFTEKLAPWMPLLQQYAPQLMSQMGGGQAPFGLML